MVNTTELKQEKCKSFSMVISVQLWIVINATQI